MASASRNERRKRRVKRSNSLLKRALKAYEKAFQLENAQKQNVILMMAAVLAQNGGEITITQGTLNQVIENVATLGFQMEPSAVDGEFLVKLVTQEVGDGGNVVDPDDALPEVATDAPSEPDGLLSPVSDSLTD